MSRPIVQQWRDRTIIRSRNVRSLAEEAILAGRKQDIAIVSLDGPLFFATTARLREDIEHGRAAARTIVLDLRRVRDIDVSGARMLRQIQQDLRKNKCDLLLAGLPADDPRRLYLAQAGVLQDFAPDRCVETIDQALELAEDSILGGHVDAPDFRLQDFEILRGLDEAAIDQVRAKLQTCNFAPGTQIFRAGDTGDGIHLLIQGMVDVVIEAPGARSHLRLATFKPGTIFGEMALLTHQPRSATAMARTAVATLFISNDSFETLAKNEPAISNRLLMNLATELAERLRLTNAALQAQI
jgi:anti-anti-sigma regulatory factor